MADPRNELADIVVPVAPSMAAGAGGLPPWAWAAGLACGVGVALAAWWWQRRRPARALRAIAAAVAVRRDSIPGLASQLDGWTRARFRLSRIDAAVPPPAVDPAAWSEWARTLTQLRFAPPQSDGYAVLAGLCQTARLWNARV